MPTALFVAILAASALITSFVSGILGMAGGMILMGVLLALMPVPAAMMLHGVTQLASNAWRAFLWRTHVDWRVFRQYAMGALAVLAAFALMRFVVSKPIALIAMGLTPFATLALPERLHLNVERRGHSFSCGAICSALSLTAGVSGPLLDVFFVRSRMSRQVVVATKAMTQSLSHLTKIVYFGGIAAIGGGNVEPWIGAMMVALAVTGTTLSRRVLERMNDASFRQWTRWTVMTLGMLYLGQGLYLLLR
ncbi:MAG TPA: sulfite exporter TauE/SafE family protein [Usitatibacter sp.]|nr:sulfite exporter TauE/SafE family protein [Usitatibacter sp.]